MNKSPIRQIGEQEFESEVLRSKQAILVAFCTVWSRPCDVLCPVLEDVAAECADSLKVLKVDADDTPELNMWYDIQSIPTLLFFINGNLHARIVGIAGKEAILTKLQSALSCHPVERESQDANPDLSHS